MMRFQGVKFSKGQVKIQQMAFVLVATIIFFALVGIFYISIRFASLKDDVGDIRREETLERVRRIAGTPEFIWSSGEDCAVCIDFDKALALKESKNYDGFWKEIPFLKIERVYPLYDDEECNAQNYPKCNSIKIEDGEDFEAHESFVALCRYDGKTRFNKCEIGKVIIGFKNVE
jgi:hypothetical protein